MMKIGIGEGNSKNYEDIIDEIKVHPYTHTQRNVFEKIQLSNLLWDSLGPRRTMVVSFEYNIRI